jgi:hypothetical protein
MEVRHKVELENVRLNALQEVEIARQEVARLRIELAKNQERTREIEVWIQGANQTITSNFQDFAKRLQKLEAQR